MILIIRAQFLLYHPIDYYRDMSSFNTVIPANTLVGCANEHALDAPSRSWCRFVLNVNLWPSRFLAPRRQQDHPIDDRINETPSFASLRRLLKMDAKLDVDSPPYTRPPSSSWCHGRYKCAEIRRPESTEDNVLRVKMYESFTQVTIFLPDDFKGVVQRLGHSGRSISCSRAALYLKDSEYLRFTGAVAETEDQVVVRTEKILHVCIAGVDPPVVRTGRIRRNSH
ncbi:hypothetical protein EDB92DRAFT_77049 [Lactarius akahatsu]|uniref:Uncharacterized protein n=1 Tax=Lactarius akahatsu TaxID=416441 RepID=A0AAD4QDA8_9AGAM|nr:hypothetical protein EDB92DRAFT_77049 [Lactarius akahatsu]